LGGLGSLQNKVTNVRSTYFWYFRLTNHNEQVNKKVKIESTKWQNFFWQRGWQVWAKLDFEFEKKNNVFLRRKERIHIKDKRWSETTLFYVKQISDKTRVSWMLTQLFLRKLNVIILSNGHSAPMFYTVRQCVVGSWLKATIVICIKVAHVCHVNLPTIS